MTLSVVVSAMLAAPKSTVPPMLRVIAFMRSVLVPPLCVTEEAPPLPLMPMVVAETSLAPLPPCESQIAATKLAVRTLVGSTFATEV